MRKGICNPFAMIAMVALVAGCTHPAAGHDPAVPFDPHEQTNRDNHELNRALDRAIVRPAGKWLANAARRIMPENAIIVPVPLHWTRMVRRRYNQSALIAKAMARELDAPFCADLLVRTRATASLDGKSREARFEEVRGAIRLHPKRAHLIRSRPVMLVDDVMTSGATLAACTEACRISQASEVCVATLARVARDD